MGDQDEAVLGCEIVGNCLSAFSVQMVCGLVDQRVDPVSGKKVCEHQLGALAA